MNGYTEQKLGSQLARVPPKETAGILRSYHKVISVPGSTSYGSKMDPVTAARWCEKQNVHLELLW